MAMKQPSSQHITIEVTRAGGAIEAIYLRLRDSPVSRSKELTPKGEVVADYDTTGHLVGVEMLDPANVLLTRIPLFKKSPELRKIDFTALQHVFA
jgi:uncharacterized protein YuzE